ncbi:MAG TPA: hypothetical protein VLE19_11250 [Pyrinomonadaceae bacterium]|nr:hypothetical protein [Pyrinomonadaceae bacterium]
MDRTIPALEFAIFMFVGMLVCLEIGRRIGKRHLAKDPQLMTSHNSVDGAIFALYGLLLAFTFSGAPSRFDTRRQLIAQEANAIGTAYLRLDLLAPDQQPEMRRRFRDYLDSRLAVYRAAPDIERAKSELAESEVMQKEIWKAAVPATLQVNAHPEAAKLLLPALNDMFDITTTRTMAMRIHPPLIIFALLYLLALVCSVLAGYGMAVSKKRSWLHIISFALVAVFSVFVVLEIEYPRSGFMSLASRYDQVLLDLRESMK